MATSVDKEREVTDDEIPESVHNELFNGKGDDNE